MITYLLAWIPMLFLAIANGIFREAVIKKWTDDATAHQLSTGTLILLLALYIHVIMQRFPPESAVQALVIGAVWMLLTLVFEFGLGLSRGMNWQAMLADYNLLKGRLWALIPIWILTSPYIFFLFAAKR